MLNLICLLDDEFVNACWDTRLNEFPSVAECYDIFATYCGYPF